MPEVFGDGFHQSILIVAVHTTDVARPTNDSDVTPAGDTTLTRISPLAGGSDRFLETLVNAALAAV